jgi:acetyl esterase/lipase
LKKLLNGWLGLSAIFTAAIFVPAPWMALLPLGVMAPELSPWLAAANLLGCVGALVWRRRLAPCFFLMLLGSAWPAAQARRIPLPAAVPGRARAIEEQSLPLGILEYRPAGSGEWPAVVDIYGGAWQRGAPKDNAGFHRYLAARGYAVFAVDYRHAPAARFPAQIEDIRTALAMIYSKALQYHADPGRMALCGRSAGGQLALLAAYQPGPVPIRAVISFYGPTDLAAAYADLPSPDPMDVRSVLERYLGGPPSGVPEQYRAASPVSYVRAGLPPTLLIQGGRDHLVKAVFAHELYGKLTAAGSQAEVLELPWAEHAFDAMPFGIGGRLALRYIEQFLALNLASDKPARGERVN